MTVHIRDYEVVRKLGEGGMAVVFQAHHKATGRSVAMKVLKRVASGQLGASLRAEIRATARLNHPNVVRILDLGKVLTTMEIEGVVLESGQDFYVMEHVGGGSLDEVGPLTWSEIRSVLVHVLAGLAHAHAFGVIHRDLKPANVLMEARAGGSLPKVADFGIAQIDPDVITSTSGIPGGTPAYMAPEQIRGRDRDHGPWTDLYAVGCMAFELVTGTPPFWGNHYLELLQQHIEAPVPRLPVGVPAPPGFESWLARALAKPPGKRFQHAADAAYALLRLPPLDDSTASSARSATTPRLTTTILAPTTLLFDAWGGETLDLSEAGIIEVQRDGHDEASRMKVDVPPMPSTWQGATPQVGETLDRTAVALFDVRPLPIRERAPEQRFLWEMLRDVRARSAPRCVVLEGEAGTGKTTLAEWLATRSEELGVAEVLRVSHGPIPTQFDGMAGAFRRFFRLGGLSSAEMLARARYQLHSIGFEALDASDQIVTWLESESAGGAQPLDPQIRVLMYDLIELAAVRRPVILLLDDVHWSGESVDFALHLLQRAGLAVLVVCTARDEYAPGTAAATRALLEQLTDHPATRRLELEVLSIDAQLRLLTSFLGLQFDVAISIQRQSEGDVRFLLHLVRDAIERDALIQTERGWEVPTSARLELPTDVTELMLNRLARSGQVFDDDTTLAVEIAAALGRQFDERQWRSICAAAGVAISSEFLARARDGLLERADDKWKFRQAMMREAILHRAQLDGRLSWIHGACARELAPRVTPHDPALLARYARHLAQAGRPQEALDPLVDAAAAAMASGAFLEMSSLLDLFIDTASCVDLAVDSPVVLRATYPFLWQAALRPDLSEAAEPMALQTLEAATRAGDPQSLAEANASLAFLATFRGDPRGALTFANEALRWLAAFRDPIRDVNCTMQVALALACVGGAGQANALCEHLVDRLGDGHEPIRAAIFERAAHLAGFGGLVDQVEGWVRRTEKLAGESERNFDHQLAYMRVVLANLRDDHAETAAQVRAMQETSSGGRHYVADMYLMLSQARHRPRDVDPDHLDELVGFYTPLMYEHVQLRIAQCVLRMHAGDPGGAREFFELARPGLATGKVIFAVARDAEHAASVAREKSFDALARDLAAVAEAQWRGLGMRGRDAIGTANSHE